MNNVNTEGFGGNKPQSAPDNAPVGITLTKAECDLALRWLDVTRLYAFVEPEDEALAAKLNAGGLSFANDGREPDWDRYAALEREHMGDADKSTGIYHPDNRAAATSAVGQSLLRPAISAANPLPPGCHCKPGQCMAPRIMGRQMPCRDPEKRDRAAAVGAADQGESA
jgi:hypothetical protein